MTTVLGLEYSPRSVLTFLRTGCQDREYNSFAEVFLSHKIVFFLARIFFNIPSNILIFQYFCKFLGKKCFRAFLVKSIGLCQLLQVDRIYFEIFRIYSPKLGMI